MTSIHSTTSTQQVKAITLQDLEIDINPQLQGKRIVFICAWLAKKLEFFQHIQKMGVKIIILDKPDAEITHYVQTGLFEAFIEADIDAPDAFTISMEVIQNSHLEIDAVATFMDYYTPLTAQIAKAMDLPGQPIDAVTLTRDKFEVRRICEAAGIPSPKFGLVNSFDALLEVAENVGFPCILKPSKGASSTDVYYMETLESLKTRYQQIVDERQQEVGSAVKDSAGRSVVQSIWSTGLYMIIEEYLDGDEFDIDCILANKQLVFASITSEKPQPDMKETGAYLPARYPQDKQDEMIAMTYQILMSLGFTDGTFHVEMKYTSKGPRLIEVNARVGGGPIYRMIKHVWGVDIIEQYLLGCLGADVKPQKPAKPLAYIASHIMVAPYSGIVLHEKFLDQLEGDPQIVYSQVYATADTHIHGPQNRVPEWLGEIIVSGETPEKAEEKIQSIVDNLEIPVHPLTTQEFKRLDASD